MRFFFPVIWHESLFVSDFHIVLAIKGEWRSRLWLWAKSEMQSYHNKFQGEWQKHANEPRTLMSRCGTHRLIGKRGVNLPLLLWQNCLKSGGQVWLQVAQCQFHAIKDHSYINPLFSQFMGIIPSFHCDLLQAAYYLIFLFF